MKRQGGHNGSLLHKDTGDRVLENSQGRKKRLRIDKSPTSDSKQPNSPVLSQSSDSAPQTKTQVESGGPANSYGFPSRGSFEFEVEAWYCTEQKCDHPAQLKLLYGPLNIVQVASRPGPAGLPIGLVPGDVSRFKVAEPLEEDTEDFLPVIIFAVTSTYSYRSSWRTLSKGNFHPLELLVVCKTSDKQAWQEFTTQLIKFNSNRDVVSIATMRSLIPRTKAPPPPKLYQGVKAAKVGEGPRQLLNANSQSQPKPAWHVSRNTSAWETLQNLRLQNTHENRIALKHAFYTFQHDPSLPIAAFIDGLTTLANQLKTLGVPLRDSDLVDVMIYALHKDWSDLSKVLVDQESPLKLAEVVDRLVNEEARRNRGQI